MSFDGSTIVSEFLVSLEKSIGVRESSLSGFALFADDPTVAAVEHCLQASAKVICLGCACSLVYCYDIIICILSNTVYIRPSVL